MKVSADEPGTSGSSTKIGLEEAPARSFLRAFLALFLFAMVALCVTSVLLDPTGVLGLRLVPPSQQTVRDDKAVALAALPEQADLLIIGSSRLWSLRPKRVSELTGMSTFNFGVDNPIPGDFEAVYHYARSRPGAHVKRILFGLEAEVFDAHRTGHLDYSRLLRPYALPGAVKPYWLLMPELLFGADVIESDVRSIRNLFATKVMAEDGMALLPKFTVHGDGGVTWPKYDEARAHGTFPLDRQLAAHYGRLRAAYASFHELGKARVDEVRALLVEARRDGVAVDLFVPPHHPSASQALQNIDARNRDQQRLLTTLAAEGLFRWFKRTRLADFDGAADGFYDFQHMTNENGDKMLENIYGPAAASGP